MMIHPFPIWFKKNYYWQREIKRHEHSFQDRYFMKEIFWDFRLWFSVVDVGDFGDEVKRKKKKVSCHAHSQITFLDLSFLLV